MTSKELQKELRSFYLSRRLSPKITAVPDGCYIHLSEEPPASKIFVHRADYANDKTYVLNVFLPEVDNRLLH